MTASTSPENAEGRSGRPPRAMPAPVAGRAARRPSWPALAVAAASLAIPVFIWWAVAAVVQWKTQAPFPTPGLTLQRLFGLIRGGLLNDFSLSRHIADSLARWSVGFGIAVAVGIPSGLLLGWSRLWERLAMPTVTVLQLIPGLAWIPVAILLFGIGPRTTIFMVAVTALAPIVINITAGVKGVDEMHLRAARMMGADDRTLFLRVLLPGSLPHLLSGLRVGFANGWRVLVAGEMVVGTGTGLGYSVIQSRWNLDYAGAFVCVAIICAIGLIVERGVLLPLERRTIERWALARGA